MKKKRIQKIRHLGTTDNMDCNVIVEVLIKSTNKIYKYKTSKYFEEKFLRKYKGSFGGWSSLNYLKENSKDVTNEGIIIP